MARSLTPRRSIRIPSLRRAFTLVELLVVVAIVAVLAGLLLPVLTAAREGGRTAACLSNLRQLHQAFDLYASDNGGYVPPFQNRLRRPSVPENGASLVAALGPYARSGRVWFCPSDPFARTASTVGDIRHLQASYRTGTAASLTRPVPMTVTMDGPGGWASPKNPFWRDRHPSETELLSDCLWMWGTLPRGQDPPYSHGGRFNYLFFDGHVKSVRYGKIASAG